MIVISFVLLLCYLLLNEHLGVVELPLSTGSPKSEKSSLTYGTGLAYLAIWDGNWYVSVAVGDQMFQVQVRSTTIVSLSTSERYHLEPRRAD